MLLGLGPGMAKGRYATEVVQDQKNAPDQVIGERDDADQDQAERSALIERYPISCSTS